MPEALRAVFPGGSLSPLVMLARLVGAMVLGALVAFIYRRTRAAGEITPSFPVTLVLLAILIAMVTQVIGDNVARAFSLVGALSIVRFRTVVRDTQDTAFVIFAVAVGMAVGANHPSVALSGIAVIGVAAWAMSRGPTVSNGVGDTYLIRVRLGVGHDAEQLLREPLDTYARSRRLASMSTARQGMALEVSYRAALDERAAVALVSALNRVEGVQSVAIEREALAE